MLAFLLLEPLNTTTLVPTSLNLSGGGQEPGDKVNRGYEEIYLSIGVTIGVVCTTVVAVTVCWYACHRRRYATQVTWLHYPTKTLPLVFPKFYKIIAMLGFCI